MGRGDISYKKKGAFYVLMSVNGARYFYCRKRYRHPEDVFSVLQAPEELSITGNDGDDTVRKNYRLVETDMDDLMNSLSYAVDNYNSYRPVAMVGIGGMPSMVAFVPSGSKCLSLSYSLDDVCWQGCQTIEEALRSASSSGALFSAVFRERDSNIFIKKLRRAKAKELKIRFLKGGASCAGIKSGKTTIFFLPDMIMIQKEATLIFANYRDVVFSYATFSGTDDAAFSRAPSGRDEYALMHIYAVSYDDEDMASVPRLQAVFSVWDTDAAVTLEKAFKEKADILKNI